LIASLGSSGAGAIAGCSGDSDEASTGTPRQVETGAVNATPDPNRSGRIGDAIYYDPDGDGPYEDGQAALDAVPSGGTLVIGNGTWDVADEGRLVIDKTMNVRGMGWAGDREEQQGTRVVNTGGDVIHKPAVEFNGSNLPTDEQNPRILGSLRNVRVLHHGDAPAIRVRKAIKTTIADCHVDCLGGAPKGLKYEDWGFFSRALRNTVVGATDICVQVTGVGYAHEFYSNHFATGAEDGTAFQTQRKRTILVGGECAATGDAGTGVEFYNPGTNGIQYGGYVVEPGIESTDKPIVIGGEEPFNDVQVHHLATSSLTGESPMITFGNTDSSKVFYPILRDRTKHGGTLAHWTDRSANCGIVTDAKVFKNISLKDEGAHNPYVRVTSSATDEEIQQFPTEVPTTVAFNSDAAEPVFHDGLRWKRIGAQDYAPGN
jgi:hypothetical protein